MKLRQALKLLQDDLQIAVAQHQRVGQQLTELVRHMPTSPEHGNVPLGHMMLVAAELGYCMVPRDVAVLAADMMASRLDGDFEHPQEHQRMKSAHQAMRRAVLFSVS